LRNAALGPDLCYMARLEQERVNIYTHGVRSVSNFVQKCGVGTMKNRPHIAGTMLLLEPKVGHLNSTNS